jgi:uncharacterized protein
MNLVYRLRIPLFLVVVAAAALAAQYVPRAMVPNNSLRVWFYEQDPNLKAYYHSLDLFGSDELIAVLVRFEGDFLAEKNVALIRELTDQLEQLETIDKVFSPTNFKDVRFSDGTLHVKKVIPDDRLTSEQRAAAVKKLVDDAIFGGVYHPAGTNSVMVTAQPAATEKIDAVRDQINRDVRAVLQRVLGQRGVPHAVGGMGIMYSGLNEMANRDVALVGSLSYLLMFVLIAVLLRSVVSLLATVTVIALTSMITLGLFGYLGYQVNMLTVALPTLLVVLSILDCVHVLTHYRSSLTKKSKERALIVRALSFIAVPCLFTTLTTALGFGSLMSAKMQVVHTLGQFAAIGVVVAYLVTFATLPLFLGLFRVKPIEREQSRVDRLLASICGWCGRTATERSGAVIAVFVALTLGFFALIPLVNVDIHPYGYFPPGAEVRRDHHQVLDEYGFYFPLEFTVSTREKGGMKDPALLAALHAFQKEAEQHPQVGHSVSLADFVKKIHGVLKPDENPFPATRMAAAQELLLFTVQDDDGLDSYVTRDGQYGHVVFKIPFLSGNETGAVVDHLLALGRKHLAGKAQIDPAGYMPLYVKLIGYALATQISGFSIAFGTIFIFMLLLFRQVKTTLLSVLPNLFPVAIIALVLAVSRIDLDFGTASIAAILLGIVVDDTIHMVFRLRHELRAAPDDQRGAVRAAINETGHAIITTSLVLCLGFSTLMLAQARSVLYFGMFLVASVAGALLADLLFLPALVYRFAGRATTEKTERTGGN